MKSQKPMDLTGDRYGKLFVIGYSHKEKGHHYYNCLCDCTEGQDIRPVIKVQGKYLRDGSCQSCGCIKKERASTLPKQGKQYFSKSEIKELPAYREIKMIWTSNRNHCYDAKKAHSFYKKGLKFCPQWDNGFLGFLFFYTWCVGMGYIAKKSQLDRINKSLGFSPENCRIIDKPQKKYNTSKKQKLQKKAKENSEVQVQPNINMINFLFLDSLEKNYIALKNIDEKGCKGKNV